MHDAAAPGVDAPPECGWPALWLGLHCREYGIPARELPYPGERVLVAVQRCTRDVSSPAVSHDVAAVDAGRAADHSQVTPHRALRTGDVPAE